MRAAAAARRVMLEYLQTAPAHRGVDAGPHPAGRLIRSAATMPEPAVRRHDPKGLTGAGSRRRLLRQRRLAYAYKGNRSRNAQASKASSPASRTVTPGSLRLSSVQCGAARRRPNHNRTRRRRRGASSCSGSTMRPWTGSGSSASSQPSPGSLRSSNGSAARPAHAWAARRLAADRDHPPGPRDDSLLRVRPGGCGLGLGPDSGRIVLNCSNGCLRGRAGAH